MERSVVRRTEHTQWLCGHSCWIWSGRGDGFRCGLFSSNGRRIADDHADVAVVIATAGAIADRSRRWGGGVVVAGGSAGGLQVADEDIVDERGVDGCKHGGGGEWFCEHGDIAVGWSGEPVFPVGAVTIDQARDWCVCEGACVEHAPSAFKNGITFRTASWKMEEVSSSISVKNLSLPISGFSGSGAGSGCSGNYPTGSQYSQALCPAR